MTSRNTDKDWLFVIQGSEPRVLQGPVSTQVVKDKIRHYLLSVPNSFLGISSSAQSVFIGSEEWLKTIAENLVIGENENEFRI